MSAAEISQLEADLGIAIPEEYRDFLLNVHGRIPVEDRIDVMLPEEKLETSAMFLLARGRGSKPMTVTWAKENAYEDVLRERIPVAIDAGGNFFSINSHGAVDFLFHERPESFAPVAPSFSEFLDMLFFESVPDDDE